MTTQGHHALDHGEAEIQVYHLAQGTDFFKLKSSIVGQGTVVGKLSFAEMVRLVVQM